MSDDPLDPALSPKQQGQIATLAGFLAPLLGILLMVILSVVVDVVVGDHRRRGRSARAGANHAAAAQATRQVMRGKSKFAPMERLADSRINVVVGDEKCKLGGNS